MEQPPGLANRYGAPSGGIRQSDVSYAADALLRVGDRPTVEKVRTKLGRGSPNTINPMLDAWWKTLSARLDAAPPPYTASPKPSPTSPKPSGCKLSTKAAGALNKNWVRQNEQSPTINRTSSSAPTSLPCAKANSTPASAIATAPSKI
jgi:hypothetical protein